MPSQFGRCRLKQRKEGKLNMSKNDWFKTGMDGAEEGKKVDAEAARKRAESRDENTIIRKRRLWLPPDSSTKFTFLDSVAPFFLREHQLFIGGSWVNFETCLSDFDNCPVCDSGNKPSYVVVFSGIDHSEYTLKKGPNAGTLIKNSKKIAVFKSTARNKILKQKERRDGDLTGCTFEITRYGEKDNASGGEFEFIKRCTADELKVYAPETVIGKNGVEKVDPDEWIKPFDYMKVFNPKSAADLLVIIGGVVPVGNEDTKKIEDTPIPSDGGNIGRYL